MQNKIADKAEKKKILQNRPANDYPKTIEQPCPGVLLSRQLSTNPDRIFLSSQHFNARKSVQNKKRKWTKKNKNDKNNLLINLPKSLELNAVVMTLMAAATENFSLF